MTCVKIVRNTMVLMVALSVVVSISSCGKRGKLKRPSDVSTLEVSELVARG